MDDKDACIAELKRQFDDPEYRFDIVQWHLHRYENGPPEDCDLMLGSLWNWSLSERWAWNTLLALGERMLDRREPLPPILAEFGMMAATGKRTPPDQKPGHPTGDINDKFNLLATVRVLTKDYGYTKTAAYEALANWCHKDPDTIRKTVTKLEKRRPFSRSTGRQ